MSAEKKPKIINVNGEQVTILSADDISMAPDLMAKTVYFGGVLAEAQRQKILIEAEYRQWRAIYLTNLLKVDHKTSEWKARARIESEPDFLKFKEGIALAERNIVLLLTVISCLNISNQSRTGSALDLCNSNVRPN